MARLAPRPRGAPNERADRAVQVPIGSKRFAVCNSERITQRPCGAIAICSAGAVLAVVRTPNQARAFLRRAAV